MVLNFDNCSVSCTTVSYTLVIKSSISFGLSFVNIHPKNITAPKNINYIITFAIISPHLIFFHLPLFHLILPIVDFRIILNYS